jgi:serine/threonine protein kinase
MNLPSTTFIRSGELLDHYRLDHLVAAGGMASIFRATDTDTGCAVAVKIPHSWKLSDRRALDRMHRESEIGAQFDHPGLVKTLPARAPKCSYVVMEWVEGRSLREIVDEHGRLPAVRAVRIAHAICDAIEYLHGRGVVHNDLKPENVMVDAQGNIKLVDLGLARETRPRFWKRIRPIDVLGTPDYASPEKIRGKASDARSDVYSLGIMLYEMLTGEAPFSGLDPNTAMNMRVLVDAPCPGELNSDISLRLRDVVRRAIARDRTKRYASAAEFGTDLAQLLAEEAHPPAPEAESSANLG